MFFQWSMFYLSFVPLWLCVLFQDMMSLIHKTEWPKTEIISICLIPFLFIIALYHMKKGLKPSTSETQMFHIDVVEEEKFLTAEFLFTFIFPLFAFDSTSWEGVVLFCIFFAIFGCICVRHNYFCTNVMLDVMKYRIYNCELTDANDVPVKYKVISKRYLRTQAGEGILLKQLNNDYCLDCGELPEQHQ